MLLTKRQLLEVRMLPNVDHVIDPTSKPVVSILVSAGKEKLLYAFGTLSPTEKTHGSTQFLNGDLATIA